jgi:hypothetical protein
MEVASTSTTVTPVLVTGIQPSANAGTSSEMDPGNKCRDDNDEIGTAIEVPSRLERLHGKGSRHARGWG